MSFVHKYPVVSFFVLSFVLGAGTVYIIMWKELPSELVLASVLPASIAGLS